ncbi:MAG: hypothetical protein IKR77_07555 [Bacteroidales bacterium]|nr:hypothetical protein [Bacteroidales bacterium]MBR6334227.1 hypothetical protein [Bacteroidales bacterium]
MNSKPVKELVDENDRGEDLFADSAYIGKRVKRVMRKFEMKDKVIKRNAAYNTLTNLVYNLCRYEQVLRLGMN